MIPIHSNKGQGMRINSKKLVDRHGENELIPVSLENKIFNFYLNREVKWTENYQAKDCQLSGNGDGRAVRSQVQRKH